MQLVMHVGWVPEDGVVFGATPTAFETPAVVIDPTQAQTDPIGVLATLDSLLGTDYIPLLMVVGSTTSRCTGADMGVGC